MNILYIGDSAPWSTSRHRADALQRLGHEVSVIDLRALLGWKARGLLGKMHTKIGNVLLQSSVSKILDSVIAATKGRWDVVWVNSGDLLFASTLRMLKAYGKPIILYNNDDPFGGRDGLRFYQLKRALPLYGLCVTPRQVSAADMLKNGAARVLVKQMSYDELVHRPPDRSERITADHISDVVFVGTWHPGEQRDRFIEHMCSAGLRVKIWGSRWTDSRVGPVARQCWVGPHLIGRDYVYALAGSKVALGFLSSGNRDHHTTRSVEIPYAGGLLCAQRTADHMAMFKDGHEAVLWESPEECVRVCRELLVDEERRKSIVTAGMQRVRQMKVGNEDVCQAILNEIAT